MRLAFLCSEAYKSWDGMGTSGPMKGYLSMQDPVPTPGRYQMLMILFPRFEY